MGAGEEHTQLFLSPPFRLFEHAPWTGLGGIGSLRLGGMKRRIVRRRVWLPARTQSSEGEEEKGRVGGGWGRRPGEIAGGRREGERPGGSRSQASGQQAGLGRSCSWVHRCGARGEKWGERRPGYLTQMHVLQERRRVRTSDCLLNPLECLHCALFFGPLVFPRTPLWAHVW